MTVEQHLEASTITDATSTGAAEDLVAAMLEEEARRQEEQQERSRVVEIDPTMLAGVGGEQMPLRDVLRKGHPRLLTLLSGVVLIDALDTSAFGVLAPDIRDSLGLSLTEVGVIGALGGLVVFLAA